MARGAGADRGGEPALGLLRERILEMQRQAIRRDPEREGHQAARVARGAVNACLGQGFDRGDQGDLRGQRRAHPSISAKRSA